MKEGDKVLVEGVVTGAYPEWVMVKVVGLQGVEYVKAPRAILQSAEKPARKAKAPE
jgi:hypothetical protein